MKIIKRQHKKKIVVGIKHNVNDTHVSCYMAILYSTKFYIPQYSKNGYERFTNSPLSTLGLPLAIWALYQESLIIAAIYGYYRSHNE